VFDCLRTMERIKNNTLSLNQFVSPNTLFIFPIYLTLNKDGTIHYLRIVRSCGIKAIDTFMKDLITQASESFPPVPDYLSKDKYTIPFSYYKHAGTMLKRNNFTPHNHFRVN